MYSCSKCKMAVVVTPEATIKACKCGAPIVAEMTAQATGRGGLQQR